MTPRSVYIGGVGYGAGNLGDDAILQGILRIVKAAAPDAKITVGTYEGRELEWFPEEPRYIDWQDLRQVVTAIKECDCFIIGGATVIADELTPAYPLRYIAKVISIAKVFGKRVAMLGIGANRLHHVWSVNAGRAIIQLCDLVTLRDEQSRDVSIELGAVPENTFTTADPAFLSERRETPRTKELKKHLRARGRTFGVNVVNEVWADVDTYKESIATACDYVCERYGYIPVFFCNEVRPGHFFDDEANKRTASFLNGEHKLLEPVYYSPGEMIDLLSTFDFIIGMRMHSLILAAIAGTPFAAVSRVDKVDNLMGLFGLTSSGSVDSCNSGRLIADIERLLQGHQAFRKQQPERVATLRQRCLDNVELLGHLLDQHRVFWHGANASLIRFVMSTSRAYSIFRGLVRGQIAPRQILHWVRGELRQRRAR